MTIWTPELPSTFKNKYEALAAAIGDDIANGKLKPGQRLPTQRQLSKQLMVTIGTIGRGYALAEKRGLISLEVGRGSFVRSFESRSNPLGEGRDMIDLGLNLPPVTEHPALLARTLSQIANSRDLVTLFGNAPVESFEQHRAAAARWLGDRIKCTADSVLICNGTQNGLVSILATLTKPGDTVLVEELTFPGIIAAAKLLGLRLHPVGMDQHGIIPEELERASQVSSVLYTIPTNQNPTTVTMPKGRRQEIARVAESRNLHLIEDDVYGRLIENAPAPIASLAPERTFLLSSLSKTLSVGLRLALVSVPESFREPMIANLRASNFFPSPLLCEIATHWINDDTAHQLLREQRETAKRRQQISREILDADLIQGDPDGNHIWMKLPAAWTGETLERAAKENGVNVYSAASFSVPGTAVPNAIRIALGAARNDSELRIGLNKIARLLNERNDTAGARY